MYEFLRGAPTARTPNRLVLDVGGVGYELVVPTGAAFADEAPLLVWTHLAVREDAHTLYGFADRETRDLFRLLLRVKSVGPGVAIAILSGMARQELLAAIRDGDVARLTGVKGIGKKTAQQVLLDLRDRVGDLAVELAPAPTLSAAGTGGHRPDSNRADAVTALVRIGFPEAEARRQVEAAAAHVDPNDLEALLRAALRPTSPE